MIEQALAAHRPQMLRAAYHYTRNLDLAEDIVQDACLNALRWPGHDPKRDFMSWMSQIIRRCHLAHLGKVGATVPLYLIEGMGTHDDLAAIEMAELVKELSPRQRAAIHLRGSGLGVAETADRLGVCQMTLLRDQKKGAAQLGIAA